MVATGSAKRFQLFLLRIRRELLAREPSQRDEVWPRELYAPFDRGLRSKLPAAMDFTCVHAAWLRELAQRVCWTRLSVEAVSPGVAWTMVRHVVEFERWAGGRLGGPESLTRELLLDYLAHVRARDLGTKTKTGKLTDLRTFLDRARIAGAPIASSATYLPGEIEPQREAGLRVRFLDAREVAQLDDPRNLARLSEFDRRLYLVLRRTGMRVSSAVTLPIDCLIESGASCYLRFSNTKARGGPREATIPIGGDLAAAVREQQQHVRGRFGDTATYLFPARNGAPAGDRPANPAAVGRTLARWARACGMTASDGSPLRFSPHRLRHTLATEMLNQGLSQRAIQDYLDHSSPDMTAVYAKLLDSTLRAEFDAYQQRVNIRSSSSSWPRIARSSRSTCASASLNSRSMSSTSACTSRATNRSAAAPISIVRNPIPTSITAIASTRPSVVVGNWSPYPTVVIVVTAHQIPSHAPVAERLALAVGGLY